MVNKINEPKMLSADEARAINERAEKATGPHWEYREIAHEATPFGSRRVYRVEIIAPQYHPITGKRTHSRDIAQMVDYVEWNDKPANRDLICHSRTDIPNLCYTVERLYGELENFKHGCLLNLEAAQSAQAENSRLKEQLVQTNKALIKAAIPLEVLAGQIAHHPYKEITLDLQQQIVDDVIPTVRGALADRIAAAVEQEGR